MTQEQVGARTGWVDRYVAEVGRMLPLHKRSDVEMEIRSLIEDQIEARLAAGDPAGEETVLDVLNKFGRPQEIASRYGAQQYLIGPALYPIFLTVLRVVLSVSLVLGLIALGVSLGVSSGRTDVLDAFGSLFAGLLQAGGVIVLVFALIERFNRAAVEKASAQPWNPRSLPAYDDADRVKVGETIAEVVFTAVVLVLMTVYLDKVGLYYEAGEGWRRFAVLSQDFRRYVPWLAAWWVLEIAVDLVALLRGRWLVWMRVAQLALKLLGIAILAQMLTGPSLTVVAIAEPSLRTALEMVEPAFKIVVGIILVVTVIDAGKLAYGLMLRIAGRGGASPAAPATR